MDNNFESLLKTDGQIINIPQSNDDVLKYSKLKIRNICRALCLSATKYEPARTVSAIRDYLREKQVKIEFYILKSAVLYMACRKMNKEILELMLKAYWHLSLMKQIKWKMIHTKL